MPKGILNKASLVMVPEAPIDGTMPSVFPEDRSGDFTFSRGSNLSATRVASNGLIEKGRENLLLQSNQFDITWTTNGANVTSGQSGYDGTNNAFLLESTNTGAVSYLQQLDSSTGVLTFSVYAKSGTTDFLFMKFASVDSGNTFFDLNSGSVVSTTAIDANIEDAGNGWYRCSITSNTSSHTRVRIYPIESGASTNSDIGDNIYIQDAQLEVGLVATDYIESGATTGKAGLLENEPRIDFTGGGCGALLLEPQRSNLITQSEYFGSVNWSKQNAITVNTNSHLSPEGIQNATELDGFDSSNFQSVSQYINVNAGTYTFSVFLKKTTGALTHYPAVVMGSIYKYVIINSTTGTYAEATGTNDNDSVTIESWDDNWWRVSLTNTLSSGAQRFAIYPSLSDNGTSITTNASGANVFFGAQLEQGSYATSYIPTYGSSVTRNHDYMNLVTTNFYNTTSYTYFLDIDIPNDVGTSVALWSDNNNPSAGGGFLLRKTAPSGPYVGITTHTGSEWVGFATDVLTGRLKIALRYNNGVVEMWYNGFKSPLTFNVTGWNQSTNVFKFQNTSSGTYKTNQFLYLPTALTDEECSALTQP